MSLEKKLRNLLGKTKRGQMSMEAGIGNVMLFAVLVITVGIVATVLSGVQDSQDDASTAWNATAEGLEGVENLAEQAPNIGTVLGAVIILTLLIGGLGFLYMRR